MTNIRAPHPPNIISESNAGSKKSICPGKSHIWNCTNELFDISGKNYKLRWFVIVIKPTKYDLLILFHGQHIHFTRNIPDLKLNKLTVEHISALSTAVSPWTLPFTYHLWLFYWYFLGKVFRLVTSCGKQPFVWMICHFCKEIINTPKCYFCFQRI